MSRWCQRDNYVQTKKPRATLGAFLLGGRLQAPDGLHTLVNTTEAARIAGVTVAAISKWRERGLIKPTGLDQDNRPLYRILDIAKAEQATRRRNWR